MANEELKLACGTKISEVKTNQRIWGTGGDWYDGYHATNVIAEVVGRDYLVLRDIDEDHPFYMNEKDVRTTCFAQHQKSYSYRDE